MDKINPAAYITDTDPVDEEIIDSSHWYEAQHITLTDASQIQWMLAQGWVITATVSELNEDTGHYEVFWWALIRRVLRPEFALQDLVASFTNAYNEGRSLNDQRYDELVAIYNVVLDKTEDSLISLEADDATYNKLIETLIASVSADWTAHNADVSGDLTSYGASERARITTQFDNQLAAARVSHIARGLYNSTVWSSVEAGIERERAVANTNLEDKITEKQLALADRLYVLKADMNAKILAARDRLRTSLHELETQRVGLRNAVITALTGFMERREDSYPDIASIGNLAASLGAGNVMFPAP